MGVLLLEIMKIKLSKIIAKLFFQVISSEGNMWKMVLIDENKAKGLAPPFFQKILCSNAFHTFILCLVLASSITGANLSFDYKTKFNDGKPDGFYYAEVCLN